MGPKAWTRGWTTMPRGCGVRTSSRAFRRPWPSTRLAAGARSSCQTRARCTVSTRQRWAWPPPAGSAPCSLFLARPVGWGSPGGLPGGRVQAGPLGLRVSGASSNCTSQTGLPQPTRAPPLPSPAGWRFRGDSGGQENWVGPVSLCQEPVA